MSYIFFILQPNTYYFISHPKHIWVSSPICIIELVFWHIFGAFLIDYGDSTLVRDAELVRSVSNDGIVLSVECGKMIWVL